MVIVESMSSQPSAWAPAAHALARAEARAACNPTRLPVSTRRTSSRNAVVTDGTGAY